MCLDGWCVCVPRQKGKFSTLSLLPLLCFSLLLSSGPFFSFVWSFESGGEGRGSITPSTLFNDFFRANQHRRKTEVRELFVYGFLLSVFDHFFNAIERRKKKKERKERKESSRGSARNQQEVSSTRTIRFATNHLSFFRFSLLTTSQHLVFLCRSRVLRFESLNTSRRSFKIDCNPRWSVGMIFYIFEFEISYFLTRSWLSFLWGIWTVCLLTVWEDALWCGSMKFNCFSNIVNSQPSGSFLFRKKLWHTNPVSHFPKSDS